MEAGNITPFPTGELMYKREAARFLGVSLKTVEGYVRQGRLRQWKNQVNGRVYYDKGDLLALLGSRLPQEKEVVAYCRAAAGPEISARYGAAGARLAEQVDRVQGYCARAGIRLDRVITDIGTGVSLRGRTGFEHLMELVCRKRLSMIVVESEDRISRWAGDDLFRRVLLFHGVEIHVMSPAWERLEYREEAKDDLTWVIADARERASLRAEPSGRGPRDPSEPARD